MLPYVGQLKYESKEEGGQTKTGKQKVSYECTAVLCNVQFLTIIRILSDVGASSYEDDTGRLRDEFQKPKPSQKAVKEVMRRGFDIKICIEL